MPTRRFSVRTFLFFLIGWDDPLCFLLPPALNIRLSLVGRIWVLCFWTPKEIRWRQGRARAQARRGAAAVAGRGGGGGVDVMIKLFVSHVSLAAFGKGGEGLVYFDVQSETRPWHFATG